MTKLRKKLLLSVLTLALTFIALGSTTFAWFTLGNTATIGAFSGSVQGGEGIDIAFVDSEKDIATEAGYKKYNWTMSVELTGNNLGNFKQFKDLTSTNGYDIKTIDKTNTSTLAYIDAPKSDYIEVSLYVRSIGELDALNLTKLTNVEANDFAWNPDATVDGKFTAGQENGASWNALNALRVSFTTEDKTKKAANVLDFNLKNNHDYADDTTGGLAYLYAVEKKHNIKCPNPSTVFSSSKTHKVGNSEEKGNTTKDYAITDVNLLTDGTSNIASIADYTLEDGVHYYIYKVTFRVWMEGWDGDCINAVLTKSVGFGFTLEGKAKTASTPSNQ